MIFFASFSEAFRSIWANPVRSFLTMLGIIIGIASVSMLVGIGEGFKGAFTSEINGLGANIIVVIPGDIDALTNGGSSGGLGGASQAIGTTTLSSKDGEDIHNLDTVSYFSPISIVGGITRKDDRFVKQSMTVGTNPDIFNIFESKIKSGRFFTEQDNTNKERVVVFSWKAAQELFDDPTQAVGQTVIIFDNEFTIIGLLESEDGDQQAGSATSSFSIGFDSMIFIPVETVWDITESKNIIRFVAQVDSAENIESTKQAIEDVMIANHEIKDYSVLTQDDLVDVFDSVFGMLSSAILGITAISLIVGGIGIMNIMLVSVTERTREIGLRKAVGATRTAILAQFLTEAIVLSLFGGAIGYLFAIVGGNIASNALGFDIPVTVESIVLAFSVSIGVGVVFGVAPAIRASQKHPIDALRYE